MRHEPTGTPGLTRSIRERAAARPRFLPGEESDELARPGDIRLAHALSDGTQRLVLVLLVRPELNFAKVCLLSNETEMLSDYDALILRNRTNLPFDLVAELDLVAPIYLIQAGSLFGRFESDAHLAALRSASEGNFADIRQALRGIPLRGPSDPRWAFKKSELRILQRLSGECMADLVDGKTEPRSVVDPALLRQVTSALSRDPDGCRADLLAIAEACQGGVAPTGALTELLEAIEHDLETDPTLQLALQPLFECGLFKRTVSTPAVRDVSFSPARQASMAEDEVDFHESLIEVAARGNGRMLRLLTASSFWTSNIGRGRPLTIEFPGLQPLYAEARDPRR